MCRLVTARREGEINILNGSVSPPLKSVIDWGEMQENVVKNVMWSAQKTLESKSPKKWALSKLIKWKFRRWNALVACHVD